MLEYYELVVKPGMLDMHYCYVSSPYGVVAVNISLGNYAGSLHYLHTDHLGSVVVITDGSKKVEQEMSYDAWGRRRNPVDWSYTGLPDPSTYLINRGYTFHEHYDQLGLINMNRPKGAHDNTAKIKHRVGVTFGRVYDPVVGRFLSVDPVVGNPLSAQDYNGYSYCANNPLKYTDPSGYIYEQIMENPGCGFGGTGSPTFGEYGSRGGSGFGGDRCSVGDYFYDYTSSTYRTSSGGFWQVSFGEVFYNYARPNALSAAEARIFISRLAPLPPAEDFQASGGSSNNQTKPGGDNPNRYVLFPNSKMAEEYINKNAKIYGKEIFFYMLTCGKLLVGPWSDAYMDNDGNHHTSPRYAERFQGDGTVLFKGKYKDEYYEVAYFVHLHFYSEKPSKYDYPVLNYFRKYGDFESLIYYDGKYHPF